MVLGAPSAGAPLAAFEMEVTAIGGGVIVRVTAIVTGAPACDEETVRLPVYEPAASPAGFTCTCTAAGVTGPDVAVSQLAPAEAVTVTGRLPMVEVMLTVWDCGTVEPA